MTWAALHNVRVMTDVLVVGGAGVDTIVRVDSLPVPLADSHVVPPSDVTSTIALVGGFAGASTVTSVFGAFAAAADGPAA